MAAARMFLKARAACGGDTDCITDAQLQAVLDYALLGAELPGSEPEPAKTDSIMPAIRANCAAEWPGDYRMQEYCINNQVEAVQAMAPLADSSSSIEREILGKCASEWRKPSGYDYRMIRYCYENQIDAYRRLNSQ